MPLDRRHLREIARNAIQVLGVAAAAIGPVVPANRIRTVYFIKLMHDQLGQQQIILYRDGAAGAVVLDTLQVSGTGGVGISFGQCFVTSGMDIEVPVYVLLEGEQLGGLIPVGVGSAFICYYDEVG